MESRVRGENSKKAPINDEEAAAIVFSAGEESKSINDSGPYNVMFKINYKTEYGQVICLAG